jgi:hypothetical protein
VSAAGHLDEMLMPTLLTPISVASRLFPMVVLTDDEALELSQGKRPALTGLNEELVDHPGPIAAVSNGILTGLVSSSGGVARVMVNFPTDEVISS